MTIPRFTVLDALTALTVVALIALAIGVQVAGPTTPLPMHFDIHGQPDRWGDRSELSSVIGFMAFMAAITAGPMSWYAKRTPDAARRVCPRRRCRSSKFLPPRCGAATWRC